jgi:hypothetical protein
MFFINTEEYSSGHITKDEARPYLQAIYKVKQRLKKRGISVSLDSWMTLSHGDRGRKLKEGQNFTLMTDWHGKTADVTVCPLCSKWREYLIDLWRFFIAETAPDSVWIEDDFRLTNHSPLFFGGCFCDKHMELYRKELGIKDGAEVSPAEFARAILSKGEPSKERRAYLSVSRRVMNETAAAISSALPADTNLGLMTSSPQVYMIEGRRQKELFEALGGGRPFVFDRIYLTAYTQCAPQKYGWNFNTISMLSAFFSGIESGKVKILPEIENFPHSPYAKSAEFTRFQIETCAALGSEGVTLSIFDFSGSGVREDWNYRKMLKRIKPYMNGTRAARLEERERAGVAVLVDENAVFNIRTTSGESPWELYSFDSWWAGYLSLSGIAYRYCAETSPSGQTVAVSGQYLRNRTKKEIESLFLKNFVLLDGSAVECLVDMGLGGLAGIKEYELLEDNGGIICYEVCEPGYGPQGMRGARVSAQGFGAFCKIEYADNVKKETCTSQYGYDGKRKADGITVIDDRVCIYPFVGLSLESQGIAPVRAAIFRDVVLKANNGYILAIDGDLAAPYVFLAEKQDYLLVINFSDDARPDIRFRSASRYAAARRLDRRGVWRETDIKREENGYKISVGLPGEQRQAVLRKRLRGGDRKNSGHRQPPQRAHQAGAPLRSRGGVCDGGGYGRVYRGLP